ncbi:very short patch repair endonuclease [Paracoccus jeotgali]|uniref:Very short patch repair endonuclease n=1 Tax=Paracoccus jeotgali TaxID=2065379 RepID=A0A2K9MBH5_9RHOB|nr:very short patch repair endonuclease [Paracoccus jeotgali]AUM72980.1 very short patch repair endonuclease [Paracoccus jeotgali]
MADSLTPEARSRNMSKIRGRDTGPEMRVRRAAHALGLRFRLYRRQLPGTPDLVFPRRRAALFVHGCFWHRHPGCRFATTPKTRADFWQAKFEGNVARDARKKGELQRGGWTPVTIWECETRDPDQLREIIRDRIMRLPVLRPD